MSHRPTPATPGGIRRPDIRSSAFIDHIIKGLTTHNAVPTVADRKRMFDIIGKRIQNVEPKLEYDNKSIPIKSFNVTTDGLVHGKKKMELSFWLPINKGYSIHVTIDVNSLTEEDKGKMKKVNFHDNSGKICSLYELYCYANGIPMTEDMLKNFIMSPPHDRLESMHSALKWAFFHGTLVLTSSGNQNFLDIIEKAGRLSEQYTDVHIPHILGMSGLNLSSHGLPAGGRGRQQRRRSLLSRKKRNTRMKKSKKYNKSKKIKK
jgi:hypothetical protein